MIIDSEGDGSGWCLNDCSYSYGNADGAGTHCGELDEIINTNDVPLGVIYIPDFLENDKSMSCGHGDGYGTIDGEIGIA